MSSSIIHLQQNQIGNLFFNVSLVESLSCLITIKRTINYFKTSNLKNKENQLFNHASTWNFLFFFPSLFVLINLLHKFTRKQTACSYSSNCQPVILLPTILCTIYTSLGGINSWRTTTISRSSTYISIPPQRYGWETSYGSRNSG